MMDYLVSSLVLLIVVANMTLGIIVWAKNKKALVNLFFGLFSISIALWILSISLAISFSGFLILGRLGFSTVILAMTFLLLFAYVFPSKNYLKVQEYFYLLFLPVIFFGISFTGLLVKSFQSQEGHLSGVFGIAYIPYRFFVIAYILSALFILLKKCILSTGLKKLQLQYVLLGISLFVIPALITNMILPGFFGIRQFNFLGPLFSVFTVSLISYAVIRHQLMDIRIIIQKGVIYTILLVIVISFYLGVVSFLGFIFQQATNITILLAAGLTMILGIFSVPSIEKYFRKATDKIFFKDRYNYSEILSLLSKILNANIKTQDIISKTSQVLSKNLKTNNIQFDLSQNYSKELKELLIIPINSEKGELGKLILGKKLSGDSYTPEDLKLLHTFANQAGVALKKAELYDELKDYSQNLEKKIKERTSQIKSLQEEQKQMMIDISHNLQTPLTVLKGELELLQKEDSSNTKFILFNKSIDEVSKFIYRLLRLAKLENKNMEAREIINLSNLLKELVEYYEILIKEKEITINSEIKSGIEITGNKDEIEELINNIVSNAIKYISNGKKIIINLKQENNEIKLTIEDTGIGIKQEDLPKIFNRFYRVKNDSYQKTKGSGLGLAICKKIIEKHSGKIEVESELGKGTKFIIIFPT